MPVTATGGLERRIAALVQARRGELEQLVRQAVEREIASLVDVELARVLAMNGAAAEQTSDARTSAANGAAERLCEDCHQRPVLRGRRICGRCRNVRAVRARESRPDAAAAAGEVP